MIWWDERLVQYSPDEFECGNAQMLHATIDLDDEYVRSDSASLQIVELSTQGSAVSLDTIEFIMAKS